MQIRSDFTKAMINTLQTGADDLTLADSNEEGANMLALQTHQSLSTTALSLSASPTATCSSCSAAKLPTSHDEMRRRGQGPAVFFYDALT